MRLITGIIFLLASGFGYSDEFVVNKSHKLYQVKTEHIRAFIEPGTVVKVIDIPISDRYKRRLRVVTPGGLEGEIVKNGFDRLEDITVPISYLKRPFTIQNEQFESGDKFLTELIDEDNGDLSYKITYPSPFLSLSDNRYYVRNKSKKMSEKEFEYYFNHISPSKPTHIYPVWSRSNKPPIEWGCGNSKKEVSIVKVGAGAKVGGSASFFSFFEADAYVNNDNEKTITYTKNLSDGLNKHRMTYWVLKGPSSQILHLALEKLSSCDGTKKLEYNYIVHFPKNENIDPIVINNAWVENKNLKPGGTSPLALNTLDDYREFKSAFKDFKFAQNRSGYDIRTAIFHYLMMITANISEEYEG